MRYLINLIQKLSESVDYKLDNETLIVEKDGKPIAWYTIDKKRIANGEISLHASVDAEHRNQGISRDVYDWMETRLAKQNLRLVPSSRLSPEAYNFWLKRDKSAIVDFVRDGRNWYRK